MCTLRKYSLLQGNHGERKENVLIFHLWVKIKAGREGNEVFYKVHWQNIHEVLKLTADNEISQRIIKNHTNLNRENIFGIEINSTEPIILMLIWQVHLLCTLQFES